MYATTRTTTTATAVSATRAVSIKVCILLFSFCSDPLTRGRGGAVRDSVDGVSGCVARASGRAWASGRSRYAAATVTVTTEGWMERWM